MNVALFDGSAGAVFAELDFAGQARVYVGLQVYRTTAQETAETTFNTSPLELDGSLGGSNGFTVEADGTVIGFNDYTTGVGAFTPDAWHTLEMTWEPTVTPTPVAIDGNNGLDNSSTSANNVVDVVIGHFGSGGIAHGGFYIGHVKIGTDAGLSDILDEDWTGGDFSNWTTTSGAVSIVAAPEDPPVFISALASTVTPDGRVLIALSAAPLDPDPTWTRLDVPTNTPFTIPDSFVAGYDTSSGRQTLLAQTDTGTATVYINDHELGLLDPRNVSSPLFGNVDGAQILLQLWDPVVSAWEPQWRGWVDIINYTIDGSSVNAAGEPINATCQLECVDVFDQLGGYGLTPGLDGITPRVVRSGMAGGPVPAGYEDGVYYAATDGTVDDRIIEILADIGIYPTRYIVASGNTKVIAVKYDPDESALQALRDACDGELPFIANMYVNRAGQFVFRGRYSRFDPDGVAAEPGSEWDFTRWSVGDGPAIVADSTRAQLREFSFSRGRQDIINVAIGYTQGIDAADMPNQVWADTASITAYGKHSAPPMSDLLTADYAGPGTLSPGDGKQQASLFAELLVKNQKDPREQVTSLQLKAMPPTDARAAATWEMLTKCDVSHIANVAVGYPAGTGFTGSSPADDYYIEGRKLTVRPLNPTHDAVTLDLAVTPAVWSMDTHSVFPAFGS